MKSLKTVFKFELMGFLKNKSYIISTLIIALVISLGLLGPVIYGKIKETKPSSVKEDLGYGYLGQVPGDYEYDKLVKEYKLDRLIKYSSLESMEEDILESKIKAGYVFRTDMDLEYIVKNKELNLAPYQDLEEALKDLGLRSYFKKKNIDYGDIKSAPSLEKDLRVLGKDSQENYLHTYILLFVLYFIILMYGQIIASSIASEKSNRTMELLITSTSTNNLIFGKVMAGVIAGVVQFSILGIYAKLIYGLVKEPWGGSLDIIFNIPLDIFASFLIFGLLGYTFYAFIFALIGALVSRTEDIGTSSTPVTLLYVGVFLIAVLGMTNTESILLKISSFLPFSSFMSMFVRLSMGSVSIIELIISLGILALSTVLMGIFASKVYRLGTLMYGKPVKLREAIRLLRYNKK